MAGRPALRSPERVQAILNALRVGNTRRASAAAAEISEDTLARWMQDTAFSGAVTKAEADAELRFLGQVAKHAAKSPQAAQWWLERRRREEYGQKSAVELTGKDGGPIETKELHDKPDDELRDAVREAEAIIAAGAAGTAPEASGETAG